eukprot:COSAG03_NODE_1906_length_3370_cov_36.493514_2_plen_133_part_00
MLNAASSPPEGMAPSASIHRTLSLVSDTVILSLPLPSIESVRDPGGSRPNLEEVFQSSQSNPAGVSQVIGNISSESAVSLCSEARALAVQANRQSCQQTMLRLRLLQSRSAVAGAESKGAAEHGGRTPRSRF